VSRPPCRSHSAQDRFNYPSLAPGAEHRLPGPRRSSDVAAATTYERCAEMFRRSSAGRRHQPRGHLLNYGERYCSRLRNWPRYWIRARICRSRGYFLSASSSSKEAARASLKSALTLCWVDSILEGYPDRVVEQNTVIVEVPRQERDTIIEEAKGRNGQVASVTTRGRPLLGDKRLTPAERMRRYRQRKAQARQKP
jgi:hypothetical protein